MQTGYLLRKVSLCLRVLAQYCDLHAKITPRKRLKNVKFLSQTGLSYRIWVNPLEGNITLFARAWQIRRKTHTMFASLTDAWRFAGLTELRGRDVCFLSQY